jgi:glycosyltransferase involved in cell wall biosynthesis
MTPGPEGTPVKPFADLAFVGSMDWLANIDGVKWFVDAVLPLVRRRKPDCTFAVIGRLPPPEIRAMAERDSKIFVTGTVADVRPYLWGSKISVVPLRIGGGTRLKIYESMAAKVPVISTAVGAEGLEVHPPENARIADSAEDFAEVCIELLEDAGERARVAAAAWEMVNARFSWEQVARCFERILEERGGR